jgi:hypothetical protein
MKTKNVLVCGDLVWDTHIARLPRTGNGYYEPQVQTQHANRHGGAWYLGDLIVQVLEASGIAAQVFIPQKIPHENIEDNKCPAGIAKGFSIWGWDENKTKDKTDKSGAWRIAEFLGCQAPHWEIGRSCPAFDSLPKQKADILVIDDLSLGFGDHEDCWPQALKDIRQAPAKIIAKATAPFDGPLWRRLLSKEWAGRVTVVASVAALRDVGARVSRGQSWDRAIEEIQLEFSAGGGCGMFRHCHRVVINCGMSGGAVFSRTQLAPGGRSPAALQFERFVFDPSNLEDSWGSGKGRFFGSTSLMTAAMVCHELETLSPSTHRTVSRALEAARILYSTGGGQSQKSFDPSAGEACACKVIAKAEAEFKFRSAYPRQLLDDPKLETDDPPPATLLTDALGASTEFLITVAEDIVRHGPRKPLAAVPRLECGKLFTVDREEIETLNSVRNSIQDYQSGNDPRPLSIAVFGAPGSGKSFAIKQLAEAILGEKRSLEFNLSQFNKLDDLHEAFHLVRDKSVKGEMPLVFWDEFDTERDKQDLGWLKEFLAPMQDAEFVANGKSHPFGKCIFIFAGGTKARFQDFDRSAEPGTAFKDVKGPDFISRLRGYVNVKGPNRTINKSKDKKTNRPSSGDADQVHVIRRALLLRQMIERHHPDFPRPVGGGKSMEIMIDPRVLNAFLRVKTYSHGSRSMEAIVSLSRLRGRRYFGPSELPPQEVLRLHASEDFVALVMNRERYHLSTADVERLAEAKHESWRKELEQAGYCYADVRNDNGPKKTHPLCRPYRELTEDQKDGNRLPARLTLLRLDHLGFRVVDREKAGSATNVRPSLATLRKLSKMEHRRWMREKLLSGRAYAPESRDDFLLHKDICKFDQLSNQDARLDKAIIRVIFDFLEEKELVLVRHGSD